MDEKTLQALTALAIKLGTTAEHLWGVMLKQALITGMLDLLMLTVWVVLAALWVYVVWGKTMKPVAQTDSFTRYEWEGEAAFLAWGSAMLAVLIVLLVVSTSVTSISAALINPEYWALMKILDSVK